MLSIICVAVVVLTVDYGRWPWIALTPGSIARFYAEVKRLADLPKAEREAALAKYAPA